MKGYAILALEWWFPLESDLRKNFKIISKGPDVNEGHDLRLTTGDLPRVTSRSKKKN